MERRAMNFETPDTRHLIGSCLGVRHQDRHRVCLVSLVSVLEGQLATFRTYRGFTWSTI